VTSTSPPVRVVYTEAVEALAAAVVRALRSADDGFRLIDQLRPYTRHKAGLAALRVLGPDALAPFVLGGHRLDEEDVEAVLLSLRVFPAPSDGPGAEVALLQDWATSELLVRLGVDQLRLFPDGFVSVPEQPGGVWPSPEREWPAWGARMARLAGLALPGLRCPVYYQARHHPLALARGVTRAMLRRDYPTAARLVRWMAAVEASDPSAPHTTPATEAGTTLQIPPLLRHLQIYAGREWRSALDIELAEHMVGLTA